MKVVPLFKVTDMGAALRHYTEVLDFVMTCREHNAESVVVDLGHDETELQLTTFESERLFGSVVNIIVDDVDALFNKYKSRGLNTDGRPESPVHTRPVIQTWGRREFYVTDTDGNTLRFAQVIA